MGSVYVLHYLPPFCLEKEDFGTEDFFEEDNDAHVYGVYTSRRRAEAAQAALDEEQREDAYVIELQLNETVGPETESEEE